MCHRKHFAMHVWQSADVIHPHKLCNSIDILNIFHMAVLWCHHSIRETYSKCKSIKYLLAQMCQHEITIKLNLKKEIAYYHSRFTSFHRIWNNFYIAIGVNPVFGLSICRVVFLFIFLLLLFSVHNAVHSVVN